MNYQDIAARAAPCPFCGEALVVKADHHGEWVGHREEPGSCIASIHQIHDEDDLTEWNTRATPSSDPAVAEAIAAERERCAKIADNISRAAAGEVRLYDSYGGPSLPGRAREVAREQAATEIAAAIRANGGEG